MSSRVDGLSMMAARLRSRALGLLTAALLAACATPPAAVPDASPAPAVAKVDETAISRLLDYLQSLYRLSPQRLLRERNVLSAIPPTPNVHLRLAMVLGLPQGPVDLVRAQGFLEGVLKANDPAAASLHPLARALANQYQERLKLETQNEKLAQQLKESQRRSAELQDKLDALSDIERSLPARPTAGRHLPGALQ
ncbi:permease [Accumulibacter sp.]|uniref:permease n=1 Tax=Accumulibacter sp. TaxID=2053492 RepID=UPI0028C37BE4|nr:permease [Accumulibacter sp.]